MSDPKEFMPNWSEAKRFDNMSEGRDTILAGHISQAKVISL